MWCEQGGIADWGSFVVDIAKIQCNLFKPYIANNYTCLEMPARYDMDGASNGLCSAFVGCFGFKTTSINVRAYCGGTNERIRYIQWYTFGYTN